MIGKQVLKGVAPSLSLALRSTFRFPILLRAQACPRSARSCRTAQRIPPQATQQIQAMSRSTLNAEEERGSDDPTGTLGSKVSGSQQKHDPAGMRGEYCLPGAGLLEQDLLQDPMLQFDKWFTEAVESDQVAEANAVCIATATPQGRPSNRMVLVKGYDERGFIFYSNYSSRKGQELQQNAFASLCFWWEPLHRSVRVEGKVERVGAAESDAYFHSRPRGSQIGAVVSHQSLVLQGGRQELEQKQRDLEQEYGDEATEIPRPESWGGYVVKPEVVEFWHGKASRLHDRLQFTRLDTGWKIDRLSP